jgi:8-oxo-dGTP pyrophosphatase MutT (NUDIX family)
MPKVKAFAYVVREDRQPPQLLVMDSPEEAGLEVVRGKQEMDEPIEETALREVFEEAGLTGCAFVRVLGIVRWRNEIQHFCLLRAPDGLPGTFTHSVHAPGSGDHGQEFRYSWRPLTPELEAELVQGCGRMFGPLVEALGLLK